MDTNWENTFSAQRSGESLSSSSRNSAARLVKRTAVSYSLLIVFMLGWVTEQFTLIDIGKYSIPLLFVAALPFCTRISAASSTFLILPLASTVFSVIIGLLSGLTPIKVLSQAALQILAIAFSAGVAAIDWRNNLEKLARVMVIFAIPVVGYGGYQMVARIAHLPFAFLPVTNQQEYAAGGLQRGWEKAVFTRASSFFIEPAAFGYFCLWLFVLGLSLKHGVLRYWALALAFSGILFSQSLSAVLGVGVLLIVYFVTHPINLNVLRQVAILAVVLGLALAIVPPLMPDVFAPFADRIQQAVALDERADSGRVDHLPAAWEVFKDAPVWGHGLSSLAASGDDKGIDVISVTYALLLMERGLIGTLLFLAPWMYIGGKACFMPADDPYKTLAILLSAVHLYGFSTSSLTYFLPFWFSLAISASLVLRTHVSVRRSAEADWNALANIA
jgi:O-Antigen ligase